MAAFAYGSVPHKFVEFALKRCKVPQCCKDLILDSSMGFGVGLVVVMLNVSRQNTRRASFQDAASLYCYFYLCLMSLLNTCNLVLKIGTY